MDATTDVATQTLPFQRERHIVEDINGGGLVLADRCDRCGPSAQAHVMVLIQYTRDNGQDDAEVLKFCAHHYRQHQAVLLKQALSIADNTGQL
jgi:hypothetical protein